MPRVVLTNTNLHDFPAEIQALLDEFNDIIVCDFPNALSTCRHSNPLGPKQKPHEDMTPAFL
jgi:hypothetical protein